MTASKLRRERRAAEAQPWPSVVYTPAVCGRESYPDHHLAALGLASSGAKAGYACDTCGGWHLGDYGPLRLCRHCLAPVLWRRERYDLIPGIFADHHQRRDDDSRFPEDVGTSRPHRGSLCHRYQRAA